MDGSGVVWALEGLAMLWVGLRQQRTVPVAAGVTLHALGAAALLRAIAQGDVGIAPQWSGLTVNLAVFVATAFASSHLLAHASAWDARLKSIFAALPWITRAAGWAWVALAIWQPLAFPWYASAGARQRSACWRSTAAPQPTRRFRPIGSPA